MKGICVLVLAVAALLCAVQCTQAAPLSLEERVRALVQTCGSNADQPARSESEAAPLSLQECVDTIIQTCGSNAGQQARSESEAAPLSLQECVRALEDTLVQKRQDQCVDDYIVCMVDECAGMDQCAHGANGSQCMQAFLACYGNTNQQKRSESSARDLLLNLLLTVAQQDK